MLRFAVIGSFWLTDEFIKALKETEEVCYFAHYSRDIEKAKIYGAERGAKKFYSDLKELAFDKDIDAVYIASPNALHYEQSKLMLEHGKHVICEKPITPTRVQFEELSALADKKGVICMEAMMNLHNPAVKDIKEIISNSGNIVSARLDFNQRSSKLEKWRAGQSFSTFEKSTYGGALMDLGVYITSLSTYLFGMPDGVFATASYNQAGADMKDTAVLLYDGFEVVCTLSKLAESRIRSEILCDRNVITIETVSRLENVYSFGEIEKQISGEYGFVDGMKNEIKDFIRYINNDREEYLKNREYTSSSISLLETIRNKIGY